MYGTRAQPKIVEPIELDDDAMDRILAGAEPAAPVDSGPGDDAMELILGGGAPKKVATPKAPKAPAPAARRAVTRFQQAATPTPDPELSWAETGQQALKNAPASFVGVAKSVVDPILHPIKTLKAVGELGTGAVSQAAGAMGVKQDPTKKAKEEGLVRALEDHYKQTYFSVKGLKKAIATDPASILMDASAVLTGGGGAAAKMPGLIGKAGKAVATVGQYADPIQDALKIAAWPVKKVAGVTPKVQEFSSGASAKALATAAEAGATSDPKLRNAFLAHMKGDAEPSAIVDMAHDALGKISAKRGENYVAEKAALTAGALPALKWKPVTDALAQANAEIRHTSQGYSTVVNKGAEKALDQIGDEVATFMNAPAGSSFHTLEGFDALKRSIGDVRTHYVRDPVAYQKATMMYNAVLDAIKSEHPEYARMMENYSQASDEINQLKAAFGSKSKNTELELRKILGAKNSQTKQTLLAELAEQEPVLPYMIAGHELRPLFPQGIQKAVSPLLTATLTGTGNIPGAIAQSLSSSPRIMGGMNYNAGRVSGAVGKATAPEVTRGAYYAGRAEEEANGSDSTGLEPPAIEDPSDTFTKMLHIESGNRQFKDDGSLVVSPVGAIGAAQVMPTTGPEAAEAAGVDWDLERLKSDEEYNKLLGRAYFEKMRATFDGDDLLAGAAYNAGPGAVKRAVKRAMTSGGDWRDYLPAETQKYVAMLEPERLQRASGGKIGHDHLVDRLMNMAKAAKRATNKTTEPLLKSDDSAIAHALHIAQQAL